MPLLKGIWTRVFPCFKHNQKFWSSTLTLANTVVRVNKIHLVPIKIIFAYFQHCIVPCPEAQTRLIITKPPPYLLLILTAWLLYGYLCGICFSAHQVKLTKQHIFKYAIYTWSMASSNHNKLNSYIHHFINVTFTTTMQSQSQLNNSPALVIPGERAFPS